MWSKRSCEPRGKGIAIQADISKTEEVRRLFEEVAKRFEGLDMLIKHAGATHIRPTPIADATDETYDWTFAVNTKGTFLCLREAANRMGSGGRIVNLSSTGVFHAHPGYANLQRGKKRRRGPHAGPLQRAQGPEHHCQLRVPWRNCDGAMAQGQIAGTAAYHRESIAIEPLGYTRRHSWPRCISRESAGRMGQWSSHSRQRWFA